MAFIFDYHKENYDSFLSWMLVHMISSNRRSVEQGEKEEDNFFEKLSDLTDGFNNVEMRITINGMEANVPDFLERIEMTIEDAAQRAATEKLEGIEAFEQLEDELENTRSFLKTWRNKIADDNGISLELGY